ncbi:MAG: replicative DNA helicase [Actinomycetota bacterium]|nr:replicative DNA helicase [Actinomycetota bacterium]
MATAAERLTTARSERIPPNNEEAEQAVLGAMMLSSDAHAVVADSGLRAEDFYLSAHQEIFLALQDLYAGGQPVDVITAKDALQRRGSLERIGGPLYLQHLVEIVDSPSSAGHWARIIYDKALLRRLILAAGSIVEEAYEHPEDTAAFADQAEGRVYSVARHQSADEIVSIRQLVDDGVEDIERIHNREGMSGIPTGFKDLDEQLQGLQKGNLVVVAARPGIGKSSLITNIARNAAEKNHPVALFSLEMSRTEIAMRLLCAEARVQWHKVRAGKMSSEEWGRITDAAGELERFPLYVVDSGNVTIIDIRAKARRLKSQHKLEMIIVDYLQLMSSHQRVDNRQQEVAEISRSLKLLAKELDIPVIAVSQLNRDPERRTDKRPQLADLRESGAIEQDSDVVMFIHRDPLSDELDKKTSAELIIAKHRNGPVGKVTLTWLEHLTQFRNHAKE